MQSRKIIGPFFGWNPARSDSIVLQLENPQRCIRGEVMCKCQYGNKLLRFFVDFHSDLKCGVQPGCLTVHPKSIAVRKPSYALLLPSLHLTGFCSSMLLNYRKHTSISYCLQEGQILCSCCPETAGPLWQTYKESYLCFIYVLFKVCLATTELH